MNALLTQLRWQFIILYKNKLIAISVAITAIYALIFFFIKDLPNVDGFLTLLIYNDPAVIGLFFVGLSIIMEKNDNVLPALFVTPLQHHTYLISRVLALAVVGWACALGMAVAMLGIDLHFGHFSAGLFSTCIIFSLAGIMIVSYTMDFLNFMLRSIPILILFSLPLFNYFGLTDVGLFEFTPVQGPLNLIIASFPGIESHQLYLDYGSALLWILLLYGLAYRLFVKRIVKSR